MGFLTASLLTVNYTFPSVCVYSTTKFCCYFPHLCKEIVIILILKSGDPSSVVNYRSISLASSGSKILEGYVNVWLITYFDLLMVKGQQGFVGHRSTASNQLVFAKIVAKCLNSRQEVSAIYTNFSKACDSFYSTCPPQPSLRFAPTYNTVSGELFFMVTYPVPSLLHLVFIKVLYLAPYYFCFLLMTCPPS